LHRNCAKQEFIASIASGRFRGELTAKTATFLTLPNVTRGEGLTTSVAVWITILPAEFHFARYRTTLLLAARRAIMPQAEQRATEIRRSQRVAPRAIFDRGRVHAIRFR
jgi:hypothetical protein